VIAISRCCCKTKLDSRDNTWSKRLPERSSGLLHQITYAEKAIKSTRNVVNHGITSCPQNAWTEAAIPERVRNGAEDSEQKAEATRKTVQTLSISRLRIITSE